MAAVTGFLGHMVGRSRADDTGLLRPNLTVYLHRLLAEIMSKKDLVLSLSIACLALGLADWQTHRMARVLAPQLRLAVIEAAPTNIDLVGIGNSLIEAGFDSKAIEQTCREQGKTCSALNGGLGGTGAMVHLALTEFIVRNRAVGTIVYGYFDQQMAVDVIRTNSDLVGNNSILYRIGPEEILNYAHFDFTNRLLFAIYKPVALLRESYAMWGDVEKVRRSLSSIGMPPEETNRFGRKSDFALMEADDPASFAARCRTVLNSGRLLSGPARELFQEAKRRGIRVIVVEMPMSPYHMTRFYSQPIWNDSRQKTQEAVEAMGAEYLNASQWIPEGEFFVDHLHLSSEGSRRFSRILAQRWMRTSNPK